MRLSKSSVQINESYGLCQRLLVADYIIPVGLDSENVKCTLAFMSECYSKSVFGAFRLSRVRYPWDKRLCKLGLYSMA